MYKPLSVLVLVALCVGVVHSWDFAMAIGNRIDFYKDDTKTHYFVGVEFKSLTALAYDALHDTLLIVDQETDNSYVYRFNFSSNDIQLILKRKQIQSIAYDPVKDLLFWLQERIIYSTQLNSESKSVVSKPNLVIELHDETPSHIAVDSCEGFVYWTNKNIAKPKIERVRFDGTVREVVLDKDIHEPHDLVIDPQMKKMFWIDIRHNEPGNSYKLKSAYLNGTNEDLVATGHGLMPKTFTVSSQFVYFVDFDKYWQDLFFYKQRKFVKKPETEPYHTFYRSKSEGRYSIVPKYTLEEQTKGIQECKTLTSLLQEKAANNVCESGYSGARCEIFTEGNKRFCKCNGNYSGSRCEAIENDTVTITVNSGDRKITLPKSADNNCTLADVLLNKIAAKVTVDVEIESN